MSVNPLKKLEALGQSIWLDFINRDLMQSGKLRKLIAEDGLRGVTSNPSIFEKAIVDSSDYDKDIQTMLKAGKDVNTIYETLTQQDIQQAADQFRDLYHQTEAKDGYVCLEVNPHLAHDTEGTIAEARQLWKALNRPNVMIKVPGTKAGLPAITQLISEGINVNVTLLFGVPRYQEVAEAHLKGLEARLAKGESLKHIASVASFFLSRIDVLLDPKLGKVVAEGGEKAAVAKKLQAQVAIASAKIAYQHYKKLIQNERFKKLQEKGAQPQRLLWASTSTKNPAYSDVMYVEALIGVDTVNTLPVETLDAYRDHGNPKSELEQGIDFADWIFQQLPALGFSIDKITQQLEDEGVDKFIKSFDELMAALKNKK
ncbi:MAG TPA: transaldolase [Gammaproteobacteria bacterium]|nr:transaldolase [Gammaproteobacteria bacterium]